MNALPQEGRGQCAEGTITGPPSITFAFRDARGHLLAYATEADATQYPVAWCVPTAFTRSGQRTVRLEGGGFFLKVAIKALGNPLGTQ
jgi:hypothetical protein